MSRNLQALRERIGCAPTNRRGYRQYDRQLRADIKTHAAGRLEQGACYKHIAKELGLAEATLLSWCKDPTAKKAGETQAMGFRPVEVRDERGEGQNEESSSRRIEPASRPVVILPNGVRVEGISLTELPEFLARLECR